MQLVLIRWVDYMHMVGLGLQAILTTSWCMCFGDHGKEEATSFSTSNYNIYITLPFVWMKKWIEKNNSEFSISWKVYNSIVERRIDACLVSPSFWSSNHLLTCILLFGCHITYIRRHTWNNINVYICIWSLKFN